MGLGRLMDDIRPMPYHGPGWSVTVGDIEFRVWAPNERRTDWLAGWDSEDGNRGDYSHAPTLAEAALIFPADIAARFEEVARAQ